MSVKLNKIADVHEGETFIQEKLGVKETHGLRRQTVSVRDFMPDQHRDFYPQLPSSFSERRSSGRRWATFVEGEPGFIMSSLRLSYWNCVHRDPSDPASEGLANGCQLVFLDRDAHTSSQTE